MFQTSPAGIVWVAALLLALGCGQQDFQLTVTFPGPLEIETGAEVRYQGVRVGSVTEVALVQTSPDEPGLVELTVTIDDGEVVLREADVFEVDSDGLMGDAYLRVRAAPDPSPPLERGAVVAGRPPLATRVVETAENALERLGNLAREQAELLVDAIADEIDEESMRPDAGDGDADVGADPEPPAAPDAAPPAP